MKREKKKQFDRRPEKGVRVSGRSGFRVIIGLMKVYKTSENLDLQEKLN